MATASLTDLTECPVCIENMGSHNKPKLLRCQHTVCEKCITGLHHRCPLCRASFPQNTSNDLPTHLMNLQLCDIIRQFKMESNRKLCDYCQEDQQVTTHYCLKCTDYLCSRCANDHPEVFDDHLPVPIASSSCIKHGRAYTMFCVDCHTLLCTVCVQQKVCCKNKNKKKIQDIKLQKTEDLIQLIMRISSEIEFNEASIKSSKTALNYRLEYIEEIRLNVRTHMQSLQGKLKQRENKLMNEINKYENEILQMHSSIDLGIENDRLDQLTETAETALVGDIEQILLTLPSIQTALTEIASKRLKKVIPGKIRFTPEDSLQVGNLHKDKTEVFNSGDCVHEHTCTIKNVSLNDETSCIGSELWDGMFVKESVMAVTDTKENVVMLVDRQWNILTDSHKQGVKLQAPCGICYHPLLNYLVVCDRDANCLCMLDPNTLSLTKKVPLIQFSPHGVAVMSNGNIVLTDTAKSMVGVFDINGTQLYSWDTYNNGVSTFISPWYVTVDRNNNIYVADFDGDKIVKLRDPGEILCEWQTKGTPLGLTVCCDKVLVAECGSPNCVREYSVEGGSGRSLLTWKREGGFGTISSIAIHDDQLTVIGEKGLKMYKLTYH